MPVNRRELINASLVSLAAAVAARYGQGREAESVEFEYSDLQQNSYHLSVQPLSPGQVESTWMV